jgi:hypothetical protein
MPAAAKEAAVVVRKSRRESFEWLAIFSMVLHLIS